MELVELTKRLEAASGPDRVLDALVAIACDQTRPTWFNDTGSLVEGCDGAVLVSDDGPGWYPQYYTASFDEAHSLRVKVRPGHACSAGDMDFADYFKPAYACIWTPQGEPKWRGEGKTMALALCAAITRSIQPTI